MLTKRVIEIAGISIGAVVLISGIYFYGKHKGYSECELYYTSEIEKGNALTTQAILTQEREFNKKQDELIKHYTYQIQELRTQNEDLTDKLNNAMFRDVIRLPDTTGKNCTGVSQEKPKPDLICYTRTELQRKVKQSLDLAVECDSLAVKYKTLLQICTE